MAVIVLHVCHFLKLPWDGLHCVIVAVRAVESLRVSISYSVYKWAATCDFQQCGSLTSVDSDKPVQPPYKLRNSN